MNDNESLARRFIALPVEKRKRFLQTLAQENIDFTSFPIPANVDVPTRQVASYAQQRMWLLWQMNPSSGAYNLPGALRLRGPLNVIALESAFNALVMRHESLRTVFHQQGVHVQQQVLAEASVSIALHDMVAEGDLDEQALSQVIVEQSLKPFCLETGPLLRVALYRLSNDEHILQVTLHHIAADGWSINIIMEELPYYYNNACRGVAHTLPALPIQYSDYALWQRSYLEAGEAERQLNYWQQHLGDNHSPLPLPFDRPRATLLANGSAPDYTGNSINFTIDSLLTQKIKALAESENATVFMVVLSVFALLLSRYSGQSEIRIGIPIANRQRIDTEGLVGFFVNTQVICLNVDGARNFQDLLAQTKERASSAQSAQDLPFEQLVEALQPERNLQYNPLFQVKFNQHVKAAHDVSELGLENLQAEIYDISIGETYFDLAFDITDNDTDIDATFAYPTALFDADTVAHLSEQLIILLTAVVDNTQRPIAAIASTDSQPLPYCEEDISAQHIVSLTNSSIAKDPNHIALCCGDDAITYLELDRLSTQFAQALIKLLPDSFGSKGLYCEPEETPVAVLMERSIDAVIVMLAIMKAGAVYMPLDVKAPASRLAYVLNNAHAPLVVCAGDSGEKLADTVLKHAQIVARDIVTVPFNRIETSQTLASGQTSATEKNNAQLPSLAQMSAARAAYIIFTSGSTGQPKGVVVTHGGLANYVQGFLSRFDFPADANMGMVSGLGADLGHTVLFAALSTGRCLHLIPDEIVADAHLFADYMCNHQVDILKIVPTHLAGLLNALEQSAGASESILPYHALILGGDRCDQSLINTLQRLRPQCRIINHYGPTETTVGVTGYERNKIARVTATDSVSALPLGRAFANTYLYVLDANLNPVPANVCGELYIGGASVARGYLNQAALTADQFIPNPFKTAADNNSDRLYRTGDRVRYNREGELVFFGRIDDQIKIRGYRVEPADAAYSIKQLDGISDVVVLPAVVGETTLLVAYCTCSATMPDMLIERNVDSVDAYVNVMLKDNLPDYLIPAQIIELASLPLTANGKLDKKALPQPHVETTRYVAPESPEEIALADIWQAALKVEKVGVHDDFFDLGGDSIRSLLIIARAKKQGIVFTPNQLFEAHTIQALLALINDAKTADTDPSKALEQALDQAPEQLAAELVIEHSAQALAQWREQNLTMQAHATEVRGALLPLSPMQEALLIHALYTPDSEAYVNQLRADIHHLDVDSFRTAWQESLAAHDSLRVNFLWPTEQSSGLQIVSPSMALPLNEQDLRQQDNPLKAIESLANDEQQIPFSLTKDPLFRIVLLQIDDDHHHMVFTYHHLLMDGWSQSLLWEDVLKRYSSARKPIANTNINTNEVPSDYEHYIGWLLYKQQSSNDESTAFWTQQLSPLSSPSYLADASQPDNRATTDITEQGTYGDWTTRLDIGETEQLVNFAKQQKITLNTLLQLAWSLILMRYTGRETIAFGSTVSGRPADLPSIENQIGLFINTLPVVFGPSPQLSVASCLQQMQQLNIALRAHEHIPLYKIQRLSQAVSSAHNSGLFDSILVVENYPLSEKLQVDDRQGKQTNIAFDNIDAAGHTSFAMTLEARFTQHLSLSYSYDKTHFSDSFTRQLSQHMTQMLMAIIASANQPIGQLSLLSQREQQHLAASFNQTQISYPERHSSLQALIEHQVDKTPEAVALIVGEQRYTYSDVNRQANQLAHYLQAQGVGVDSVVGVAMERSTTMVIALLAIIKAGAAYMPIDADHPSDRIAYMLDNSQVRVLLTHQPVVERVSLSELSDTIALINLDRETEIFSKLNTNHNLNPDYSHHRDNIAYLIYTSGSTGQPKGVAVSHEAIVNRLLWMQETYCLNGSDRVLQKTPYSFDVSVWEFFWPLISGAALVVAPPDAHHDPALLCDIITKEAVTTMHFVPSMLSAFIAADGLSHCHSMRRVICSGEALSSELQQQFLTARHLSCPELELHNLYGPTEAAVDVSAWACKSDTNSAVPIGTPIANICLYILDQQLNAVPAGIVGELYIGGVGLARGYYQRAALTAERFIPDPFSDNPGARLYRTGDLARYRDNGVIDYLGRSDHQVKIRGLRIELTEVESQILVLDNIKAACVVADVDTTPTPQLVAYVVPSDSESIVGTDEQKRSFSEHIKTHLREKLPDYMVPHRYHFLPAMPLSVNGKLDRKQLPRVDSVQRTYSAPSNNEQQQLVAIWEGLFQREKIGIHDDFFELGGDSLIAIQLLSRIRSTFDIDISIQAVFGVNTIADLAVLIAELKADDTGDDIAMMEQLLDEVDV